MAMRPLAQPCHVTHQHVHHQRHPDLPPYPVGRVADQVAQLQGLLQLLEEHLHLPPRPVQLRHRAGRPPKVVRQEHHLPILAVHLHRRPDPSASRPVAQVDHLVLVHPPGHLAPLRHGIRRALLHPGHPEDPPFAEVREVRVVRLAPVKDHVFPLFQARSKFPGAAGIRLPGGVDDDISWEEGLEVQADMGLGGGLATAVAGPVHAVGAELDDGGIHDVDRLAKLAELAGEGALGEPGGTLGQMREGLPEQALGDGGGTGLVGVGKGVAAGGGGATNGAEDAGVDVGLVAEVIESEAMDDLGGDEGDDMAPVGEGASVVLRVVLPNQLGEGMAGNEVAKLLEDGQLQRG